MAAKKAVTWEDSDKELVLKERFNMSPEVARPIETKAPRLPYFRDFISPMHFYLKVIGTCAEFENIYSTTVDQFKGV